MNVIEAIDLGKRYGNTRALHQCSLAIPAGHVAALVGPNGAGKSTLLNLAVGLSAPSEGDLTVLGGWSAWIARRPWTGRIRGPGHPPVPDLVRRRHAAPHPQPEPAVRPGLRRGPAWPSWESRCKRKAGKLSGGQQAQLALTLALARHPQLLLLDEPVAMGEPIDRRRFVAADLAPPSASSMSMLLRWHAPGRARTGRRLPHPAVAGPGADGR